MTAAAASFALVLTAGFCIGFHVKHRIGRAYRRRMLAEIERLHVRTGALTMERDYLAHQAAEARAFLAAFGRDVLA